MVMVIMLGMDICGRSHKFLIHLSKKVRLRKLLYWFRYEFTNLDLVKNICKIFDKITEMKILKILFHL